MWGSFANKYQPPLPVCVDICLLERFFWCLWFISILQWSFANCLVLGIVLSHFSLSVFSVMCAWMVLQDGMFGWPATWWTTGFLTNSLVLRNLQSYFVLIDLDAQWANTLHLMWHNLADPNMFNLPRTACQFIAAVWYVPGRNQRRGIFFFLCVERLHSFERFCVCCYCACTCNGASVLSSFSEDSMNRLVYIGRTMYTCR